MRAIRRRSLATVLIGTAAAGIMAVSANSAAANTWVYKNFYLYQSLCQYQGQQDEAHGYALSYSCNAYTDPNTDEPGWQLWEYVD